MLQIHQSPTVTALLALCAFLLVGCTTSATPRVLPEVSTLPTQSTLPDSLIMFDGRRVTTPAQWQGERRRELKEMFEYYMYGPIPLKPKQQTFVALAEYRDFLNNQATLKLLTIETGPTPAPKIDLMLVLPNRRSGPV